jgi:hypothetical protein
MKDDKSTLYCTIAIDEELITTDNNDSHVKTHFKNLNLKKDRDLMHKLTAEMDKRLKGIKHKILNSICKENGKFSKWDVRTFQVMLEYKLLWLGLAVRHVSPKILLGPLPEESFKRNYEIFERENRYKNNSSNPERTVCLRRWAD